MFNFGQAEAISFPLRNIENFKSIDLAGDAANGTKSLTINTNALTGDGNCEICQLITFTPGPSGKAGIAYRSNNALDLTGAQRIVFFAKGELGGENLAFVAIGKDKTNGQTSNTLSASPKIFKKLTFAVTTQNVTLVNDWKRYQISLNGIDLTGVTAPFGIIVSKDRHQTPPSSPGKNRPPLDDKDPNHIVFFLKGVTIDNNLAVNPLPVVTNTTKGATSPAAAVANTTTAPTGTPVQNTSPRIPTTTTPSPTTTSAGAITTAQQCKYYYSSCCCKYYYSSCSCCKYYYSSCCCCCKYYYSSYCCLQLQILTTAAHCSRTANTTTAPGPVQIHYSSCSYCKYYYSSCSAVANTTTAPALLCCKYYYSSYWYSNSKHISTYTHNNYSISHN